MTDDVVSLLAEIHQKNFDKVNAKLDNLLVYSAKHDQHLSELNGSIVRHDKQILELYKDFDACNKRHDKQINWNENRIYLAIGGVTVISLLSVIATITKMMGVW